ILTSVLAAVAARTALTVADAPPQFILGILVDLCLGEYGITGLIDQLPGVWIVSRQHFNRYFRHIEPFAFRVRRFRSVFVVLAEVFLLRARQLAAGAFALSERITAAAPDYHNANFLERFFPVVILQKPNADDRDQHENKSVEGKGTGTGQWKFVVRRI